MRAYLANLRSNLRSFVQRAQRNAAGKASSGPAGAPGAPVAPDHRATEGMILALSVRLVDCSQTAVTMPLPNLCTLLTASKTQQQQCGMLASQSWVHDHRAMEGMTLALCAPC